MSCCVSYWTLLMANIKNRKKMQLIQTIWDVMLYSQHFTFHWKLLGLVSRIQKCGTGENNFGKWKGTFRSDRPKWPDRSQWTTFKAGALSIQPKIPVISVGTSKCNGPFRFGPTGIFGTSFEGGPLWPVWSFRSVGPKCPSLRSKRFLAKFV